MYLTAIRRNSVKFFCLLVLLAGFGVSAQAQQVVTTPTGSKLEVRVIPEKDKILPGEPIEVAVEYRFLKPEGGTPDKQWKQDVWPILQGRVFFAVYREDGLLLSQVESTEEKEWVHQYDTSPDTLTRFFFIPRWCWLKLLRQPGMYRLQIQTEFTTVRESPFPAGPLKEQPIHFSVEGEGGLELLPEDNTRMGTLIQDIGGRAMETDFNQSWDRLYWIDDPRVIPFFLQKLRNWLGRPPHYAVTIEQSGRKQMKNGIAPAFTPPMIFIGRVPDPVDIELARLIDRLAQFQEEDTLRALVDASTSKNETVRKAVARNLPQYRTPQAFSALAAMSGDTNDAVREAVAVGLANDSAPETEDILVEMFRNDVWAVHEAARKSLLARKSSSPK